MIASPFNNHRKVALLKGFLSQFWLHVRIL